MAELSRVMVAGQRLPDYQLHLPFDSIFMLHQVWLIPRGSETQSEVPYPYVTCSRTQICLSFSPPLDTACKACVHQ